MTDNLRDRIAAVLYDRALSRARMSWQWADLKSGEARSRWLADADAVIEALGVHQEAAFDSQTGQLIGHRYVTEWSDDEVQ